MGCYHPMKGVICQDGRWRMHCSEVNFVRHQAVPCGQCIGCRLDRSRSWAVRCMHEASLYSANCFITLTYDNEHCPKDMSLNYDHFQKFMKRLRKRFSGSDVVVYDDSESRPIRFYMAGEYGEKFGRPHFHACIFNFDFVDKFLWSISPSGQKLYRSPSLEELWPYGFSSVGDVTFQSAAYVARYIMKKVTGKAASEHYIGSVDPDTGEVFTRQAEFNKMSLRPGIGAGWFDKFSSDVYPHDYVVLRGGQKVKPPRFYDNLYKRETGFLSEEGDLLSFEYDELKFQRAEQAAKNVDDNTTDRLLVKETIAISRLSRLKRTLT